nr:putative ribonuclease H-like domain-containing protein [Tanacetum cinerariifolium]
MNVHDSAILEDSLPPKENNPGSFTISCYINNICFEKALADLGASVSVMPYSTFSSLGLCELALTKLIVELADRTIKRPKGLRERMQLDLEVRLMGEALILNRSLDPVYEDFIELNDLNEPLELRRSQVEDLALKDLDNLIESQRSEKNKEGLGYTAVPLPTAQLYLSPKKDLSSTGLPECVDDTVTDYSRPSPTEESISEDDQKRNTSVSETIASPITSKTFIKFVRPKDSQSDSKTDKKKTPKKPPVKNFPSANRKFPTVSRKFPTGSTKGITADMGLKEKAVKPLACYWDSGCSRHMKGNISYLFDFEPYDGGYVSFGQGGCKIIGKGTIKTGKLEFENVYFVKDLKYNLFSVSQICDNKNSVLFTDSKCILLGRDFKLLDDANILLRTPRHGGGKITGKGIIKTGKLEFENVYFVKELKYNLFSMSQIYDNKNSVLFTDSECIVLEIDFKLNDDTNVLLRNPRQHNMYFIDLNNIASHKNLTCLVAKASVDESMLWHRRLGHLNFKTMNNLVRNNLVKNLPSKCFENDHTCVAFLKGKQHKASCKTKLVNSVSKPLHTLHMDLFGPTSVSILIHKWYCLVVTNDFSRFTCTFFLRTKDETSSILRNFITEIESIKDLKVKIIRCDNRGEFKNKEMNEFYTKKGIKRKFSNARTPQQNGVAERRNRTLIEAARTMLADAKLPVTFWSEAVNNACTKDAASQAVKKDVSSLRYIALPNWFHEAHMETSNDTIRNSDAQDDSQQEQDCNADVPESSGISNPTATLKVPSAEQVEPAVSLTMEYEIPTVSSPDPTVCLDISPESSSGPRLITKGDFSQKETPSLGNALTLSNSYASFMGFIVYQMDVKSAFLYGTIDEEVYVMQPPRFQDPEFPDRVYKVEKAMGTIDQTLFIRKHKGEFLLVQVYVDDIIFGSSNPQLCREFEALMHDKFQMSALGELTFFLELQVLQKKDSIFLSQDKYVGDILKKFGYSDVQSANTPMDKENPWGKD